MNTFPGWTTRLIVTISAGLIISYCYNNFLTKSTIVGKYVNRNYNYKPFLVEIPYVADTLTLLNSDQFESTYWGKGSYSITRDVGGTHIDLKYNYEFGKAGYNTSISRPNWGSPKIILDRDRNHFYEKTDK